MLSWYSDKKNLSIVIKWRKIIRINIIDTYYFRLLITLQLQEQLEQLVETHQQLDLEGSCERYARA